MSMRTPKTLGLMGRGLLAAVLATLILPIATPVPPADAQTRSGWGLGRYQAYRRPARTSRRARAVAKTAKAPAPNAGHSARYVVPGVRHVFFRTQDHGVLNVHLLEVDLKRPDVRLELSQYRYQNRQATVARLASHHGVVAAINGSFFQFMPGAVATPVGIVMVNGQVIYDTRHRRTSFGINTSNEAVIGVPRVTMMGVDVDNSRSIPIHGVNTRRGVHQTILYTPHFNTTTRTNVHGRDIIVRRKQVVGYTMGNATIPRDGYVLSINGMGREVVDKYPLGTHLEIATIPEEPRWDNLKFLITGGPHLVHNGRVYNTYFQENFRAGLMYPNARSAVGITADQKLLLMTVNPARRGGGITYTNLAKLLLRMKAVEAMNLDGGSSATLYVNGRVVNRSDGWNRPVNNALLIYAGSPASES